MEMNRPPSSVLGNIVGRTPSVQQSFNWNFVGRTLDCPTFVQRGWTRNLLTIKHLLQSFNVQHPYRSWTLDTQHDPDQRQVASVVNTSPP
jgi:hypothetical protein